MSPEVAAEKVRALAGVPKATLVGWQVITEPETPHAEGWTVYAGLRAGVASDHRS